MDVTLLYYRTETSVDQGLKTFKQRREEERKAAEANGDTRAWNTFFMRSDTVSSKSS